MTITVTGAFETDRRPDELWAHCTDPDIIAASAPGMTDLNRITAGQYEAVIAVEAGRFSPTFTVDTVVTELSEPTRMAMVANADGGWKGGFEAGAEMTLSETESGGTVLEWTAEAVVTGTIATLGDRAIGSVTKRAVHQFFDNLAQAVEGDVEPNPRIRAASDGDPTPDDGANGE